jgi:hypothetical protein
VWKGTSYEENPWKILSSHLDGCKKALLHWQWVEIGRLNRDFEDQCNNFAIIQGKENSPNVGHALELQRELQGRLEQKELRWRQRAKINWLANGDRNSKYFHACAKYFHAGAYQCRKGNKINKIRDEGGRLWETQEEIGEVIKNYFNGLFSSNGVADYEGSLSALEGAYFGVYE